jgi:predicted amidohydrolase
MVPSLGAVCFPARSCLFYHAASVAKDPALPDQIDPSEVHHVTIRIAGIQMPVRQEISGNAERILSALDRATGDKADFLLTPEGALSGYTHEFDTKALSSHRDIILKRARSSGIGLALGTCSIEADGLCYNQIRVLYPDGREDGFHSKILRCAPLDDPEAGELRAYATTPLRTFRWKDTTFGCLICNDLWATPGYTTIPNPYPAWQLQKMGSRFILHSVNCGSKGIARPYHESALSLWALALKIPIVTVNACPEQDPVNSMSGVMGPQGEWLLSIPDSGEQYFYFDLDV